MRLLLQVDEVARAALDEFELVALPAVGEAEEDPEEEEEEEAVQDAVRGAMAVECTQR